MSRYKLALALGGGGVRCMAHVGVIDAIDKEGIKPDLIVGSSIGSVIGGVYAYRTDPEFLYNFAIRFADGIMARKIEKFLSTNPRSYVSKISSFLSFSVAFVHAFWNQGIISPGMVKRAYRNVVGEGVLEKRKFFIEDTAISFAILTSDIKSARAVIITKGDIADAMYASSAMPGVCKPLRSENMLLMDGGIISLLPVMAAHILGAERIIAVDTEARIKPPVYNNSIEALDIASSIRGYRWNLIERSLADMVISADEIRDYGWYQFSKARECIKAGRKSVEKNLEKIKGLVSSAPDKNKRDLRLFLEGFYPYAIV